MEPSDTPWAELSLWEEEQHRDLQVCCEMICGLEPTWHSHNNPKCCFKMEATVNDYPGRQEAKLQCLLNFL